VSPAFARELNHVFEAKRARGHELTLDAVRARPLWIKLRNRLARLFSPWL